MGLFQENKNLLFQAAIQLINNMVETGREYSENEIKTYLESIITEEAAKEVKDSLDDKINDLLYGKFYEDENELNSSIFQKNQNNGYEPKIKLEIPYIPDKLEKYALSELIQDPTAKNLLSKTTLEKLYQYIEAETRPERYIYKNQRDTKRHYEEQQELNDTLQILMKAMISNKMIRYDNQTKGGLLKGKTGTPYKFVYSLRLNRIQLIVKPEKEERGVLVNLEGLKNISILERNSEGSLEKWFEEQKSQFILKIIKKENQTKEKSINVVERCFSLFSHLDKEAVYNKEEDVHIIKIKYYKFDQEDIVRDILSMGSDVVVLEPKELREKIIANII